MNIIFFGSDDFALVSLERLFRSNNKVLACVTQPDKPKGRGMKLQPSVIKEFAVRSKIPVLQPDFLRYDDVIEQLKAFQADLFIVIAYGKILPPEILLLPNIFCVNVHGSLLPKYRGAAPINWAIINGDKKTGVTVMKLNEMMDAGEIISQQEIDIAEDDTAISLRMKMAQIGAELLAETIATIENKTFKLTKQDFSMVTNASKLTKELGIIRWTEKAQTIHDLARGLLPWPGAFTFYKGKRLKVLETRIKDDKLPSAAMSGCILEIGKNGFVVAASDKPILVTQVHYEDGKPMNAYSFAQGHRLVPGHCFES